jgi:phosphoglycolate phosphatase
MNISLLIFDLDGTLIDSKQDLVNAVNATRASLRMGPLDADTIASYVGNGAPMLIRRAIGPGFDEDQLARALEHFLTWYRDHCLDNTMFYPGVREALDAFGDRTLAVLTNKPVRISRYILEGLGVLPRFKYVFGGNSFDTKKPHPEGILTILRDSGVPAEQALMVGDSEVDVLTGRNAGVLTCGVSWGFAPHTFQTNPPDLLVHDLGELAAMLDGAKVL